MLKNNQGFTLIESMTALIVMSAFLSLFIIQFNQKKMVEEMTYHQTNAYHILDNVLMELNHEVIHIENDWILIYNENYEKDEEGIYEVRLDLEKGWIRILLKQSQIEVFMYEFQKK